ncbi:hypothetical protein HJG60_011498 [Phyllostomus discolor]|uniref:Uncharacterized protein n=1 Tax=Phyllostomus discolor TaxID=89673 RepID=A0A834DXD6_9CHIR|nr:hypothetical protein HJG60_011498 [Phyllostomus discolor]
MVMGVGLGLSTEHSFPGLWAYALSKAISTPTDLGAPSSQAYRGAQGLPHHLGSAARLGREEAGAASSGEFLKQCLFFYFFFLRNSSYSSLLLHTEAWPFTEPYSPMSLGTIRIRAHHSSTLNSPHLASTDSMGVHRPCVFAT